MADLTGRVIKKRYRVEQLLGRGSMAEVYRVHDLQRGSDLAMKVLREDLAEDNIFIKRFQREAQTLKELAHGNIVRFYGLDREGDVVFLLMEFIHGATLRKVIAKRNAPFTTEMVLAVMGPMCSALNFAHQSGRVHCDIKPANLMIDENNHVVLTDFGIARMSDAATATMVGAGTPAYMAPEQIRGENPTAQSDIYALGVMLFEMLTGGERPFKGEKGRTGTNTERIRWEQLNTPAPPPSQYNPKISKALDVLVLRCLEKNPKKRFKSTVELFAALKQALGWQGSGMVIYDWKIKGETATRLPIPAPSIPKWVWIAGGAVLLILVMFLASSGGGSNRASSSRSSFSEPVTVTQVVRVTEVVVVQSTATPRRTTSSSTSSSSSSSSSASSSSSNGTCYANITNLPTNTCGKMRVGWGSDSAAKHCNLLNGHRVKLIARSPDGQWVKAIAPDSKVGWVSMELIDRSISGCNLPTLY